MFAVTLKQLLLNCLGTLPVTKDKLIMPNSIALRALNLSCEASWKYLQGSRLLQRRWWHPTPVLLPGKIPWMEEPGRLQSMGLLRVGHDWATSLSLFTFMHWRRKWQPTPVFLPGESQGQEAWWAAIYAVAQSWTRLKWRSSSSSSLLTEYNLFSLFI